MPLFLKTYNMRNVSWLENVIKIKETHMYQAGMTYRIYSFMLGEANRCNAVDGNRQDGDEQVNKCYPVCKERPIKQNLSIYLLCFQIHMEICKCIFKKIGISEEEPACDCSCLLSVSLHCCRCACGTCGWSTFPLCPSHKDVFHGQRAL